MIIEIKNIHKQFGGNVAVGNVSLGVKLGRITSIIGPNGSGKSTLFNIVAGFLNPDSGRVKLQGLDITGLKDFQTARKGLARTFQEIRVFTYLTVRQHLDIVCDVDNEKLMKNLLIKANNDRDDFYKDQLKRVGLEVDLDTLGSNLSYGQSKLLNLAMCLITRHGVILLDEPVAGVNPLLRKQIKNVLLKLRDESENILIIEHDMNFVTAISDWIVVMDSGNIITEGTVDEILNNHDVLQAYLGR